MKLILEGQHALLIKQGHATSVALEEGRDPPDHKPVVKLFTPDAGCTWLLSELDPQDPDIAFGLCDLGIGFPELGTVRISELASIRGRIGLPVERDIHFQATKPLSAYVDEAYAAGRVLA